MDKIVQSEVKSASPFLRWAGGKQWLKASIDKFLPIKFGNYYEPFLGGGSMYFHLLEKGLITRKRYLNDLNQDLILCYDTLKKAPHEIIAELKKYRNNETSYYRARSSSPADEIKAAARFMYLNRTCFNGIYRVNKDNELKKIVSFDVEKYRRFHAVSVITGYVDILDIGYTTSENQYEPPVADWRKEMRKQNQENEEGE